MALTHLDARVMLAVLDGNDSHHHAATAARRTDHPWIAAASGHRVELIDP